MPEMPEVETIRRGLETHLVGQTITRVEVRLPKMTCDTVQPVDAFLKGKKITQLSRIGKLLVLHHNQPNRDQSDHDQRNSEPYVTLIHLKMTGQLIYRRDPSASLSRQVEQQVVGGHPWPSFETAMPNAYTHVQIQFESGGTLYFNDQRQFGYIRVAPIEELVTIRERLGIEPLQPEFTWEAFRAILEGRRGNIKALLLNQQHILGIGNIYADEILFDAAILPTRSAESLSAVERQQLYYSIQHILALAIKHRGTTIHDYADADGKRGNFADLLRAYAQEGKPCQRCGAESGALIVKAKIAGRGTHWCLHCQH